MKPNLTPIREFKRLAESALPGRVKTVVLYDSRARGDARPGSDCDVAVFIKGGGAASEATALSHIGSDFFFDRGWNIYPSRRIAGSTRSRRQLLSALGPQGWYCRLTDEIAQRVTKAPRLVRIAKTYDAEKDAEGVAHHAYYAMYHAAIAVLLLRRSVSENARRACQSLRPACERPVRNRSKSGARIARSLDCSPTTMLEQPALQIRQRHL